MTHFIGEESSWGAPMFVENIFSLQNEVGTCRERGEALQETHLISYQNKCRVGAQGQAPKDSTGMENEVGTPCRLHDVPNTFCVSCIYIYIHTIHMYNVIGFV